MIWVLVPLDREGDEVTVHLTRIRPYYGPRETGKANFPGVKDIDDLGDELAMELTKPVTWVPPIDEFFRDGSRQRTLRNRASLCPTRQVTLGSAQLEPERRSDRRCHNPRQKETEN